MKRSKLFLGITTGLLTIAGIAVAKTHRHSTEVAARTSPAGAPCGGQCVDIASIEATTTVNGNLWITNHYKCTVYTNINFQQNCVVPAYYGD